MAGIIRIVQKLPDDIRRENLTKGEKELTPKNVSKSDLWESPDVRILL